MTVKEWLKRGLKINDEINQLLEQKQMEYSLACSATISTKRIDGKITYGERVQESIKNSSEDKFVCYAEYSKMIDDRVKELYKIKQEILQAINQVDNATYRTLLISRYINFKTWEQIAVDMNFCLRQVFRIHGKALTKIKMS